jgi:hypothetical protein
MGGLTTTPRYFREILLPLKGQPSPAIFHCQAMIEGPSLSIIGDLWLIVRVVYIQHTFC